MYAFQLQEMAKTLDIRRQKRCMGLNVVLYRIERRMYGIGDE